MESVLKKEKRKIRLGEHFTYGKLLRFAMPSVIMMVFTSIYGVVDGLFISNFVGKTAFAAVNLIMPVPIALGAVGFMVGAGGSAIVAKTLGEGDEKRAGRIFTYASCSMLALAVLLYAAVFFFAAPIAAIFNSERDPALQAIAVQGLRLYFLAAPFAGANIILAVYFASVEQAVPAQAVSLLRGLVVIVPLAVALAAAFGMPGVWLAFPVCETLVAAVAFLLLRRMRKALP